MLLKTFQALRWVLLCSVLVGCADLPAPPSEPVREQWGALAVVPARYPPQSNFVSFAVGQGAGVAKGAAGGAAVGVGAAALLAEATAIAFTGGVAAAGIGAAVVAPYLAVTVPVFTAGGAIAGSQLATSEQDVAALETQVQHNLTALQVPDVLAQAIVAAAAQDAGRQLPLLADAGPAAPEPTPNYAALAQRGVGSVLEVVATEVGFTGGKHLSFYLVAHIRMVRASDGSQLYQREFVYQSDEYRARLWGENQAALFQAELQRAYASLADSVVEQVFLFAPLPLQSWAKASGKNELQDLLRLGRDACGLAWVSPEREVHFDLSDVHHRDWNRFPSVASLQPTLAWESFPRDIDKKADAAGQLSGISNVRYDLRVWKVVADAPPTLVYERRDLAAASHTLEQPLLPASRYFWSARARFDLGGAVHGTNWGYFRSPNYESRGKVNPEASPAAVLGPVLAGMAPRDPCTLDFIPTSNYYRFQTP
jgi:hypothetical protein